MSERRAPATGDRSPRSATSGPAPTEIAEILDTFPGAPIDHDNLSWYEGLRAGEVRIKHCRRCGARHHPPGSRCPRCWSTDVVAEPVVGAGVVELVTVLHVGPAVDGIDYQRGHPIVSVALDGVPGIRVTGPVVDVALDAIEPGLRVECAVIERDRTPTLVFRAAPDHTG